MTPADQRPVTLGDLKHLIDQMRSKDHDSIDDMLAEMEQQLDRLSQEKGEDYGSGTVHEGRGEGDGGRGRGDVQGSAEAETGSVHRPPERHSVVPGGSGESGTGREEITPPRPEAHSSVVEAFHYAANILNCEVRGNWFQPSGFLAQPRSLQLAYTAYQSAALALVAECERLAHEAWSLRNWRDQHDRILSEYRAAARDLNEARDWLRYLKPSAHSDERKKIDAFLAATAPPTKGEG